MEISPRIDQVNCAKFKADPGEPGLLEIPACLHLFCSALSAWPALQSYIAL